MAVRRTLGGWLAAALRELSPDAAAIVDAFQRYMAEEGRRITGDEFRVNLAAKLDHPGFAEDGVPLLKPGTVFDLAADAKLVEERILSLLPDPKAPAAQRIAADERMDAQELSEKTGYAVERGMDATSVTLVSHRVRVA